MNKEQLVPDIELCRQLKEAGFPQEGCAFYWNHHRSWVPNGYKPGWGLKDYKETDIEHTVIEEGVAAPTASELGELLPDWTLIEKSPVHGFFVQNQMECPGMNWTGKKLPNVLSETYLYLSRNGLLKGEGR